MAGSCIEKLPHTCGSSDGLQVFQNNEGTYSGYCFSCDTYVSTPYEGSEERKSPSRKARDHKAEIAEISSCKSLPLPSRSLKEWALAHFNVKVGVSEQDGITPVFRYYPYTRDGAPVRYKVKLVADKKMWWVGEKADTELFGWQQAISTGSPRLYITEGEDDAVALYQALMDNIAGTQWEGKMVPAVVSLTNGAGGAKKEIAKHLSLIRGHFKEVRLVFDNDEHGREATRDVVQLIPKAQVVAIPGKDANECVIQGRSKALAVAVSFNAKEAKTTRLIWGQEVHEAARTKAEWGLSYPWQKLTDLTRGMRFGETYYWGAGVKMGKSELVNALAAHLITEHGLKVFMAKPEETNKKTYQLICGKVAGKVFHDPTVEFDFDAYDKASALVGNNVCMLNLYQRLDWRDLRDDIHVAVQQGGCKAVFIDPITNLSNGISSGEANTLLQEIAQDLAAVAMELNIIANIFCHLKAPESGNPHERGGKVLSHQFAGSRAMMRLLLSASKIY